MTKANFLRLLAGLVDAPSGSLTGEEELERLENWDSTAIMEFIALIDERFSVSVSGREILQCATVNELVGLLGDRVSS